MEERVTKTKDKSDPRPDEVLAHKTAIAERLVAEQDEIIDRELRRYEETEELHARLRNKEKLLQKQEEKIELLREQIKRANRERREMWFAKLNLEVRLNELTHSGEDFWARLRWLWRG